MAERRILQIGDPLLWQQSAAVEDPRATDVREVVLDLSETLASFRREKGFGRGIAGPQIGVLSRIIFLRMQPTGFCSPLINPRMVSRSAETMELWDDCFSIPDLMMRVSRAVECRVAYTDESGAEQLLVASGDLAELVQHEMDHLDGILAVDRMASPRALCTRAEWERLYRRRG
jgi:peptide deformylase